MTQTTSIIAPPMGVTDHSKLAQMVKALENGNTLPPVVALIEGEQAFSGSHRIAAYRELDLPIPVVGISDGQYRAAMEHLGYDPDKDDVSDFHEFVDALRDMGVDLADAE